MSDRKVHPNAKLKTLAESVQEEIWNWLEEDRKRTLAEAVEWMRSRLRIETSVQRLSEWRGWYRRNLEVDQIESEVGEIEAMLRKLGDVPPEKIEAIGNTLFLNRATKAADAKTFTQVAAVVQGRQRIDDARQEHADKMAIAHKRLEQKQADLEIAKRKLELLEAKVSQASDVMEDTALTDEEKVARWKMVFGR